VTLPPYAIRSLRGFSRGHVSAENGHRAKRFTWSEAPQAPNEGKREGESGATYCIGGVASSMGSAAEPEPDALAEWCAVQRCRISEFCTLRLTVGGLQRQRAKLFKQGFPLSNST
jgi:hypothetical protein